MRNACESFELTSDVCYCWLLCSKLYYLHFFFFLYETTRNFSNIFFLSLLAVSFRYSVHFGRVCLDAGVVQLVLLRPQQFWCCWHVYWPPVRWDCGIRLNFSKRKKSSAKNSINNGRMCCVITLASRTTGHMCWHGPVLHQAWSPLFYCPVLLFACAANAKKKNNWICNTWCQVIWFKTIWFWFYFFHCVCRYIFHITPIFVRAYQIKNCVNCGYLISFLDIGYGYIFTSNQFDIFINFFCRSDCATIIFCFR